MNEQRTFLAQAIAKRRTIKPDQYTGEKVSDTFIRQILEAANWAPTHGYTEPWRFRIYTDEGLAVLGEFLADHDQPDRAASGFNRMRYDRLRNRPLKASHVIGVGMKRGDNPKVPEWEEIAAVAMAVQNMWLMAHTLGLGAYWSTGSIAFSDRLRDFFEMTGGDRGLGLFYLGKPAENHPEGRRRSSIDEKVQWIRNGPDMV